MEDGMDALVVGGGPTGLTMAAELSRRGLRVRLIDKALVPPTDHSRALAVQSRTMELFEQFGVANDALARGRRVGALNVVAPGQPPARLELNDFTKLSTPFPQMTVIRQEDTERVLCCFAERMGTSLERGVALSSFTQDDAGVTAVLARENGTQETVRAKWLIGCDGSHSPVRKTLGISFDGDTYTDQCLLGEVVMDWASRDGEMYVFPSATGIAACFPVPGEHTYRVILVLPEPLHPRAGEALELPEFESVMRALVAVPFQLKKVIMLARYRLHHRVASQLRKGRVFLCGDAAHIHSPVGGQGMNTGIQDAFNLAWKLAAVQQKRMPAWVLDTYEAERMPVARRLVNVTDRYFGYLSGRGPISSVIRRFAPRLAARAFGLRAVQGRMTGFLSQLRVRYPQSPFSVELGVPPRRGPRPGERAPDGRLRNGEPEGVRLFELFRGMHHTLLLFTGPRPQPGAGARLGLMAQRFTRPDVKAYVVSDEAIPGVYADEGGALRQRYGVDGPAAVFVRPDGYISLRSDPLNEDAMALAFSRWFIPRA